MFRKGGEAMTGIMENIAPRQNYAEKGNVYDEADAIIIQFDRDWETLVF